MSTPTTITGTYKTQYDLKFAQSGLDNSAQGTIVTVTVDGGSPVNVAFSGFPKDFGYVDAGTTVTYTFTSPVPSSSTGEQFVLTAPDPTPASGFSLSEATMVTGTYKTQYLLTIQTSGLSSSSYPTNVYFAGSATSSGTAYDGSPYTQWFDANSYTDTIGVDSPINGGTGTRFVFTGWSDSTTSNPHATIQMTGPVTLTGTWVTQYALTFVTNGHGTPSPPSGTWENSGAVVVVTIGPDGSNTTDTRHVLDSIAGSGSGSFSTSTRGTTHFSVTMNAPITETLTWVTQYDLQFAESGLDSSAQGTIATVTIGANSPANLAFGDFTKDFGFIDAGTTIAYTFTSPVASSNSGEQFVLTTPVPTPSSDFSVSAPTTVTGTYKTQYDFKFAQSGLDGSATGTIVSVTIGANPTVNVVFTDFPKDFGFVDAGTSITYVFTSPVSSSNSGEQFVLTTPDPSPSSPFSLSSATTVTGTYKTQYDLQFAQSGLDSSAQGTMVSVTNGALISPVNVVFTDFPKDFGFVDAGTTITYGFTSPVPSSNAGEQFVLATPAPSPASGFSLTAATTVMGTYKTQWLQTFAQAGLSADASGAVVTVNGGPVVFGSLPYTTWVDDGSTVTYVFTSPVPAVAGKQYVLTAPAASPSSPYTASAANTVTGTYKTQWQVTFAVSPSAGGTIIQPSSVGPTWYDDGAIVNIQAGANPGYTFQSWSATVTAGTGISFGNSNSASTTATIHGTGTITANIPDITPPAITKSIPGTPQYTSGSNTYVTSATTLRVNIVELGSGIKTCTVSISGPSSTSFSCSNGNNDFTLSSPTLTSPPDGTYVITVNAQDNAGNKANDPLTVILDNTAPVITLTSPTGTYILNQPGVTASFSCNDGTGSGVAASNGCVGDLNNGASIDISTAALGAHTFKVTSKDNLGNTGTKINGYSIEYSLSCGRSVLQPLEQVSDPKYLTKTYKQGSTLPIKFYVCDANGVHVSTAVASLAVLKVSSGVDTGDPVTVLDSGASNDNGIYFRWDSSGQQYIYNLSTKNQSTGTYRIVITLNDGTLIITYYQLKS